MTFSENSSKESTTSSPRFFWTSDEPAQFECAIQGVTSFEDCGSGTSGTWTGKNVPDGRQTFLVRARDLYGNRNRNPARFPFEIGMFFMFILLHSNPESTPTVTFERMGLEDMSAMYSPLSSIGFPRWKKAVFPEKSQDFHPFVLYTHMFWWIVHLVIRRRVLKCDVYYV